MSTADDEFDRIANRWYATNDQERLRLVDWFRQAITYRGKYPDRQADLMTQARDEAQRLNETWMALYFDYWKLDAIASGERDFVRALPLATEVMARFCTREGREHAIYSSVMMELLYVYAETDPFGYSDVLDDICAILDKQIEAGPTPERFLFDYRRTLYLYSTERCPEAYDAAVQSLGMANLYSDRLNAVEAEYLLCRICWSLKREDELTEFAKSMAENSARDARFTRTRADALLWLAYHYLSRGNVHHANHCFDTGLCELQDLNEHDANCIEPITAYLEAKGDPTAAASVLEREATELTNSGRVHLAARFQIERCRLLKQAGELTDSDFALARDAANKNRHPDRYLAKLQRAMA